MIRPRDLIGLIYIDFRLFFSKLKRDGCTERQMDVDIAFYRDAERI
jgi:hypothetical protein